ncbi:MAG: hypothetical protein MZV65_46095 [Chromatiales bacterium]|nr:hypothetical protein [Chromatiales bacterium]
MEKLSDSRNRLIVVVGASGSGKSSLVAAGLLPRLKNNAVPGSQDWLLDIRFTPGEESGDTLMALAEKLKPKLGEQSKAPFELADELGYRILENSCELVELLLQGRPDWAELLLFVDQFEELFTLVAPRQQGPFVALLAVAAKTPRVRIVATLRADFSKPACGSPNWRSYCAPPLSAGGSLYLDEMITGLAKRAGLTLEKGLVERIHQDTGAEPGAHGADGLRPGRTV